MYVHTFVYTRHQNRRGFGCLFEIICGRTGENKYFEIVVNVNLQLKE